MLLEKTKIYGVDGVGRSSPTLTRTDAAVGLSYSIGASEISSDFSHCFPWSEMQEVVDDIGNVFIRVPKFYTKVTKNEDGTYKYQISGCRYDGFSTLFIDGKGNEIDYVLVGKYEASGSYAKAQSKSKQTVLNEITIGEMRAACKANGDGYQQYDFLIDAIIKQLFMIEFATTNSQSIMTGWTNAQNAAAILTGHTDAVKTASGSWNENHTESCPSCNSDGFHACKYRGIENPWGNVYVYCDGISFYGSNVYICLDPAKYTDESTDMPYIYIGDRNMSGGFMSKVTPFEKIPLLGYCTETQGDGSLYYCDTCYPGETVLSVGGCWFDGGYAGLWNWCSEFGASFGPPPCGGRLCYKPL